jgi:class 3 adenylate cyclase
MRRLASLNERTLMPTSGGDQRIVGRLEELGVLDRLAQRSLAGRPTTISVLGMARSGKSRLVAEGLTRSFRDALVLQGRGTGTTAIPYLPVALALRSLPAGADLAAQLIDPRRMPDGDRSGSPPEFRLFGAVLDTLVTAAQTRSVALVLEDLDRSDLGTLALLRQLVSGLSTIDPTTTARLLCVYTYRPAEDDAVARALGELAGEPHVTWLELRPLAEPEVMQLLTDIAGVRPAPSLLSSVMQATGGVPGLVEDLTRLLFERRALSVRNSELYVTALNVRPPIPLDQLARGQEKVARLSTEVREFVLMATLLGQGQLLDDLQLVLDRDDDSFSLLFDQSIAAGCLKDVGDSIALVDDSIGVAAMHDMSTRRQRLLHARIARRLIQAGDTERERSALVIAHHLEQAGPAGTRFCEYVEVTRQAGELALACGAYAAAATHFEAALAAVDQACTGGEAADDRPDLALRGELLLGAGLARFRHNDSSAALVHLNRAIDHARGAGALDLWGRAVLAWSTAATALSNQAVGRFRDLGPARSFLVAAGDAHRELRARVLQRLSQAHFAAFDFGTALELANDAASSVPDSADGVVSADIEFARGLALIGLLRLDEAFGALSASARQGQQAGERWIQASALGRIPLVPWMEGRLVEAHRSVEDAIELDRSMHNWSEWSLAAATATGIAAARGEFGLAERLGTDAELLYRRSGYGYTALILYPTLACVRANRGDIDAAHDALDRWAASGVWGSELFRPLVEALAGSHDRAVALAEALRGDALGSEPTLLSVLLGAWAVELGDLINDPALIRQGCAPVGAAVDRGVVLCPGWNFFLPRLEAVARWRLGDSDDPLPLLRRAARIAARAETRGELARTRADIAALLQRADPNRAQRLEGEARRAFAELGLLPLLRRAREPSTGAWQEAGHRVSLGERAFFLSDIVDSTGMTRRLGVRRYTELLDTHNHIVRACLRRANGSEFRHTGDGLAAWFNTALDATACALDVQRDLADFNDRHVSEPLRVRIGLSCGEVILDADQQFQGLALVVARRLCDLAASGQVLASHDFARSAQGDLFRFEPTTSVVLKGFSESEWVYAVHRTPGAQT